MWYLEVYLQNCQLSTETGGARGVFALQLVAEQATQNIYIGTKKSKKFAFHF